jgi:hypothetical protein
MRATSKRSDSEPSEHVGDSGETPSSSLLQRAELPSCRASVAMTSGRRYRISSDGDGADRLVVTSDSGAVVLSIEVTDRGPVLTFTSAEVRLQATETLRLQAREVEVHSAGDMRVDVAGALRERIGSDHHLQVHGTERVEAHALELQASSGHVGVRAMHGIALDGEHIGLNDDPLPQPFAWSAIADEFGVK